MTTREQVMQWWNSFEASTRQSLCSDYYNNRQFDTLTGREIEKIWRKETKTTENKTLNISNMKTTTIFIIGNSNFWYHTEEIEYSNEQELELKINNALSSVRSNLTERVYENNDEEGLNVILGEIKYSNLSV